MLRKAIFLSSAYILYDIYHNRKLLANIMTENYDVPFYKINPPDPVEIKKLPFVIKDIVTVFDSDIITPNHKKRIDDILNGKIITNVYLKDNSYSTNEYIRKYNNSPLTRSATFCSNDEKGMMGIENRIYDEGKSNKIYHFIFNNNSVTILTKNSLVDKMRYTPDKITFNDISLIQKILFKYTCYVYNKHKTYTSRVNLVECMQNKHDNTIQSRSFGCGCFICRSFYIPTITHFPVTHHCSMINSSFTTIYTNYLTDDLCKWLLNERKNVIFYRISRFMYINFFKVYCIKTHEQPNKTIHVYIENFEKVPDILRSDKRFHKHE